MNSVYHTELSSLEETRGQFNGGKADIKLGIDVHQDFYVVVMQVGGSNPKPPQRFHKQAFLLWAAKLKSRSAEVHAVYEACGFGFSLQRQLSQLSIDQGAASKQPTHPHCAAAKNQCADSSVAGRGRFQPTARPWCNDQCDDRSGDWRLAPL